MEVTDLKGLKKLMKGDATHKFEFVEDHENNHEQMMFSYSSKLGFGKAGENQGATYNTYNPANSSSDPRQSLD